MHRNWNIDPVQFGDKDQSILVSSYVLELEAIETAVEGEGDVH